MQHGLYQRCKNQSHHLIHVKCSASEYATVCELAEIDPTGLPVVTETTDNFREGDMLLECNGCLVSEWESVKYNTDGNMYRIVAVRGFENVQVYNDSPSQEWDKTDSYLIMKCNDLQEKNKILLEQIKELDYKQKACEKSQLKKAGYDCEARYFFEYSADRSEEFAALKTRIDILHGFIEEKNAQLLSTKRKLLKLQKDFNALSGDPNAYAKLSAECDQKQIQINRITTLMNTPKQHIPSSYLQRSGVINIKDNEYSMLDSIGVKDEEEWC